MSLQIYTMCGHPTWSDAACQTCDGCRDGRLRLRGIESASQNLVAKWENEGSIMLEPVLDELRASLDGRIRDLEDTLALRDAATRSLCIAIHGHDIEGKSIYDLILDADKLRQRTMTADQ